MDRGGFYAEEHATLALTHIYFVECCIYNVLKKRVCVLNDF